MDETFFGIQHGANAFCIARLKYSDCHVGNRLRDFVDLNNTTGINISLATYFRLRLALTYAAKTFEGGGSSQSIESFFASYKKGSKYCRKVLGRVDPETTISKLQVLNTFYTLVGTQSPEYKNAFNFLPLWNTYSIPNRMRDFLFKFYNNQLGLNTRTSHFGGETRSCTFCFILKKPNAPDETFSHLFFDCEVVKNLHNSLENTAFVLPPDGE